ncbi:hypothetical protein LT85_1217 [Collimonas arenae]|uniref:Uncharacterized protein n=1 Tax=Collimonas arenae TaxID=279058 RepID=A0A0A1F9C3_9BURK|nr:hypothetical protein LT85_1217 [Collimonas arenae]
MYQKAKGLQARFLGKGGKGDNGGFVFHDACILVETLN